MKKILGIVCIGLAILFGSPPSAYAVDVFLFNAATADGTTPQGVVQVGGDGTCECQIVSTGTSVAVVTVYAAISATGVGPGQSLIAPTVLMSATDPNSSNPDNYQFGACPNFVTAAISGYGNGTITVKFRSKK